MGGWDDIIDALAAFNPNSTEADTEVAKATADTPIDDAAQAAASSSEQSINSVQNTLADAITAPPATDKKSQDQPTDDSPGIPDAVTDGIKGLVKTVNDLKNKRDDLESGVKNSIADVISDPIHNVLGNTLGDMAEASLRGTKGMQQHLMDKAVGKVDFNKAMNAEIPLSKMTESLMSGGKAELTDVLSAFL